VAKGEESGESMIIIVKIDKRSTAIICVGLSHSVGKATGVRRLESLLGLKGLMGMYDY